MELNDVRVALVSCVKSKLERPAPAKDLYTSALFCALRAHAEANADAWFILSAEHGLVHPTQVLAPYERTLNRMGKADREEWATRVQADLVANLPVGAEVIVLAAERYREAIVPFLRARGHRVEIPLEGLPFGRQLQRLKELRTAGEMSDLERFYVLIDRLASLPGQGGAWPSVPDARDGQSAVCTSFGSLASIAGGLLMSRV